MGGGAPAQPAVVDHAAMGHGASAQPAPVDHAAMGHGAPAQPAPVDHAAMGHGAPAVMPMGSGEVQSHNHPGGPGVANTAEAPSNRLGERGVGLVDVPHRVLVYTDLKSLEPNPDTRPHAREVEVHLTSNMERYMWSFDGRRFSEVVDPIQFYEGERVRLTMVNDTMMPHPIHLHGMFFDVVNGETNHEPRKHTITIKPGEKLSVDVTPEEVGDWAFHCHLLYHMHAGMFQVVSVKPARDSHQGHSGHQGQHGDQG